MMAGVIAHAHKAVGQDATAQVGVKLASHKGGQAGGLGIVVKRVEKGFQMLGDDVVEHRVTGIAGVIGGNRWGHKRLQVGSGSDGNIRSCQVVYGVFREIEKSWDIP
jgi:hypothetical protein